MSVYVTSSNLTIVFQSRFSQINSITFVLSANSKLKWTTFAPPRSPTWIDICIEKESIVTCPLVRHVPHGTTPHGRPQVEVTVGRQRHPCSRRVQLLRLTSIDRLERTVGWQEHRTWFQLWNGTRYGPQTGMQLLSYHFKPHFFQMWLIFLTLPWQIL